MSIKPNVLNKTNMAKVGKLSENEKKLFSHLNQGIVLFNYNVNCLQNFLLA